MTTNSTSAPRTSSSSTPSLLRDQLAQFNGPAKVSAGEKGGRSALGWMLTLCGMAMSGWVLFAIHAAIFHPERLGLPLRIIRAEDLAMLIPSGKVQLPAAAITLVGYMLTVLLLAIAGKIAIAQIKLGVSLLLESKRGDDVTKIEV